MKKTISTLLIFLTIGGIGFAQKDTILLNEFRIEEVVIKATRTNSKLKNLPHKVEVVRADVIKNTHAKDVGELLKKTSSIDIVQYPSLQSSIGIRGFAPSIDNKYSVLLINGMPAGTQNIATISTGNIEQVEVLKGPFSSLYGSNAMGGVINIVTSKNKGKLKGYADLGYGSFQTTDLKAGIGGRITNKFSFDFSFDRTKQGEDYKTGNNNLLGISDFKKLIISDDTYGKIFENTKFEKMGANIRLGYDLGEKLEVNFYSGIFSAKDVLSNGSFWNAYGSIKKDLLRYTNFLEIITKIDNHTIRFSPYLHNDLTERYYNLSDSTFIESNSRFINYGFQLQDRIRIRNHSIVIGVDNETRKKSTERWAWVNEVTAVAPYVPDFFSRTTGLFAQSHLKFLDGKLNISIGLRYDMISLNLDETDFLNNEKAEESFNTFNPNIGVKYEIIKGFKVYSSMGTAFLAPDAFQKAGSYIGWTTYYGNPDLDPEISNTFDLGFEYSSYENGIYADITFFNTNHKNVIVDESVNPDGISYNGDEYTTYTNANKANMYGIEVNWAYDLGALSDYKYSLKAYLNFDYLLDAAVFGNNGWEDMKYVRKAKSNFGLEYNDFNHFSTRINARYIGIKLEDNWFYDVDWVFYERIPYTTMQGNLVRPELINHDLLEHPEHLIVDLSANYTFSEKYTLGISVANLFDENYAEKDGFNMPGRNITGKFSVKF